MRIATLIAGILLVPSATFAAATAPANTTKTAPAAGTRAAAPAAKSDEDQLKDLEQQWLDHALKHDDANWEPALLMDDFQDVSWQGELRSKADVLAASAAPVTSSQTLSDLKVRVHGDLGVVTGINTTEAADKSFTVKVRFTDVFVKVDGKWRALSAQETIDKGS